jgi:hypothetical protein
MSLYPFFTTITFSISYISLLYRFEVAHVHSNVDEHNVVCRSCSNSCKIIHINAFYVVLGGQIAPQIIFPLEKNKNKV